MTILITGALGFVGRHLAAHLVGCGHEVWGVEVPGITGGAYARIYTWEQLDEVEWAAVDGVVHLAGKAHDTRNVDDPQSYFDINVGLTQRILEALATAGGRRRGFVLFSSVKAVADSVAGVLTEEERPDPRTPYGRSKLAAEKLVLAAETVEPYVLRPSMIYGAGGKGNLNLLYGIVRRGLPWPLGAFENQRSFAAIENVCAVVEGLLVGAAPAGIYQVADDEALSTNELVRLLARAAGRRARIWRLPVGLMRGVARLGDVLRLPLNSERLQKLTESYVVSNAKVKRALGWERMRVGAFAAPDACAMRE